MILHWKKYSSQFFLTSMGKTIFSFLQFGRRLNQFLEESDQTQIIARKLPMITVAPKELTLCYGCGLCETICPADCLTVELPLKASLPPKSFKLNAMACVVCGLCEEVCPGGFIKLAGDIQVYTDKSEGEIEYMLKKYSS